MSNQYLAVWDPFDFKSIEALRARIRDLPDGIFWQLKGIRKKNWELGKLPKEDHLIMLVVILGYESIIAPLGGRKYASKADILKKYLEKYSRENRRPKWPSLIDRQGFTREVRFQEAKPTELPG